MRRPPTPDPPETARPKLKCRSLPGTTRAQGALRPLPTSLRISQSHHVAAEKSLDHLPSSGCSIYLLADRLFLLQSLLRATSGQRRVPSTDVRKEPEAHELGTGRTLMLLRRGGFTSHSLLRGIGPSRIAFNRTQRQMKTPQCQTPFTSGEGKFPTTRAGFHPAMSFNCGPAIFQSSPPPHPRFQWICLKKVESPSLCMSVSTRK